jgi:prepilin-type N-terminal cleavage/methylation domain-containing protein
MPMRTLPMRSDRAAPTVRGLRRGFTITEVAVVLGLIGILTASAVSRVAGVRQSVGLETATQQLAGELRKAQIEATRRNRSVGFTRIDSSTYKIDFGGVQSLGTGVVFDASVPTRVEFAAFGPPNTGAATMTLKAGGRRKTVKVESSGFLRVGPSVPATSGGTSTLGATP